MFSVSLNDASLSRFWPPIVTLEPPWLPCLPCQHPAPSCCCAPTLPPDCLCLLPLSPDLTYFEALPGSNTRRLCTLCHSSLSFPPLAFPSLQFSWAAVKCRSLSSPRPLPGCSPSYPCPSLQPISEPAPWTRSRSCQPEISSALKYPFSFIWWQSFVFFMIVIGRNVPLRL